MPVSTRKRDVFQWALKPENESGGEAVPNVAESQGEGAESPMRSGHLRTVKDNKKWGKKD